MNPIKAYKDRNKLFFEDTKRKRQGRKAIGRRLSRNEHKTHWVKYAAAGLAAMAALWVLSHPAETYTWWRIVTTGGP